MLGRFPLLFGPGYHHQDCFRRGQASLSLKPSHPRKLYNQPSTPNPSPAPSAVEAMDVESSSSTLTPLSQNSREGRNSGLLPYLLTFFNLLSHLCSHTNKNTMPYSVNSLWKKYNGITDKLCTLSSSCFQRIWKQYFRKKFVKACQHDKLCQLCKIGHKIEKKFENSAEIPEPERKKSTKKKTSSSTTKSSTKKQRNSFNSWWMSWKRDRAF
jgi:hypothetical protein